VRLAAIVVVGADKEGAGDGASGSAGVVQSPLSCIEILGQSVVERIVDRFLGADVETVTVLVAPPSSLPVFRRSILNVEVRVVQDLWIAATQALRDFSEQGIDYAFVAKGSAYAECDLVDLAWFHRGTRQAITRAFDQRGSLDFWIADCAKAQGPDFLSDRILHGESGPPSYFISEYVNRLLQPGDLRRLVVDLFKGRCETRIAGREIRPGVWVDDGAHIHKRARIVAPAYIGRKAVVRENTLITRCSSIETLSYIDYGTVIEDASILANSYVGIWLDVSHAVLSGNRLMSVARNVLLEISDPSVIRDRQGLARQRRGTAARLPQEPLVLRPRIERDEVYKEHLAV
jgi:NDP-sugar pyrophosphorylase family protein